MDEKCLFKLALTGTIVGTILLYILTLHYSPYTNINSIDKSMVGYKVKVNAKVVEIVDTKKLIMLKLNQNNDTIKAVYFKTNYPYPDLTGIKVNKTVTLKGKISQWNNELQIIIESLER